MNVVLIAPPYPLEETPTAPLGLCYVASAFMRAGAEVRILDYIVCKYSPEKLVEELSGFVPVLIGITSVTMNFPIAASIIRDAKGLFPEALAVMGGPHVSFDYADTLKTCPEIDLIVVGEGEQTIAELAPVIHTADAWQNIPGLAFRDETGIVFTGKREFIRDIDSLPEPARHLLPMSRYLAMGFPISIITSRGCPNRCIFCQGHQMVGHKIRSRDPNRVLDEIESLLAYGFERINFSDDFFTSNKNRVKQICRQIHDRGLNFKWTVFARADSVDIELLTIMKDAGCDTVFFGIESGNQEMLNRIKKNVTLDRIRKAVADCKAVGMAVFGSFIVGLPGETFETMMDSHRFAKEIDVIYGYHFLAPFPGTEVMEKMSEYDLELLTRDWAEFDANRAIVRTSNLSPEDIEHFVDHYYMQNVRNVDADTEKRFREGRLTPTEQLVYFGQKKLEIVFELLSGDIIEEAGPIPIITSNGTPADQLSGKILPHIVRNREFVQNSIQHLADRGYLTYTVMDDNRVWRWADKAVNSELKGL
jgi:anaerobic magnesium-protoporphyrin IX monomethyl ester cyclase